MTVAQATDLRVHPNARGLGLGDRMLEGAFLKGFEKKIDMAMATIIEGNGASFAVIGKIAGSQSVISGGRVRVFQLLPIKPYHLNKSYCVRTAVDGDIPEIAALLRNTYKDYFLAPDFNESWLRKELRKTDTFTIRDFRVAERNGKIVACAAFWDQGSLQRKVLVKLSPTKTALLLFFKIFRRWLGVPSIPGPGDPLKFVHLRFPASSLSATDGLKAILHKEMRTTCAGKDSTTSCLPASTSPIR
jgi:hypothetical protein